MKKVFLMILMASAMIALTTGCDKKKNENGGGGDDPTKKMLPSEIISKDYGYTVKFSYDSNNRITNVIYREEDEWGWDEDYTYDDSGRLTRIDKDRGFTSLEYSGNSVIITFYDEDFGEDITRFELQGDRISKVFEINEYGEEVPTGTITYDSKGNVTRSVEEYSYDGYYSYTEISATYADKKGVYSGINMPHWFLVIGMGWMADGPDLQAVNNPLSVDIREEYSEEYEGEVYEGVYTTSISYDYNSYKNDYPEKFTVTWMIDDNPVKKSKALKGLQSFNRKKAHINTKRASYSETVVDHFEIKYIEAK